MTSHAVNAEREQVDSDEWFGAEFRKILDEEFPETACPAAKAVEGVGYQRVKDNRFAENPA